MYRKIYFEDEGQDFTQWVIDENNLVIECLPAQGSIWCGARVGEPVVGECLPIITPRNTAMTLGHPVTKVDVFESESAYAQQMCRVTRPAKPSDWTILSKNERCITRLEPTVERTERHFIASRYSCVPGGAWMIEETNQADPNGSRVLRHVADGLKTCELSQAVYDYINFTSGIKCPSEKQE